MIHPQESRTLMPFKVVWRNGSIAVIRHNGFDNVVLS